ncbi:hypothetical protein RIF29_29194 [Crotalaria pallida]|uniref:F-box domain-containing protein n=1 Tax=Crotalaria pallida TaxID=3830 RepID=A0AAN9HX91_CROPI
MKRTNIVATKSFQDLCPDILVRIFMTLNVVNLVVVSMVCKSWNVASRDATLWYKINLTRMSSPWFNIPKILNAWSDRYLRARMARFLKYVLHLSNSKTNCLIFNSYVQLNDKLLILAAQRTPNLKRLVLSESGHLSKRGIDLAMASWGGLQSITITSMLKDNHFFSAMGKVCKNITEVKFTCSFEEHHADDLIKYTPGLKALSIRNQMVNRDALFRVLDCLQHLEVVNVCHSLFWDTTSDLEGCDIYVHHKNLHVSWLGKIISCEKKICIMCNKVSNNTMREQPYDPLEELWSQDEIPSLSY